MIYRLETPILGRVEVKNDHGVTVAIVTIGRGGGAACLSAMVQGLLAEGNTVVGHDGEKLNLMNQGRARNDPA